MSYKADRIIKDLGELEDEPFAEVLSKVTDRIVEIENPDNYEPISIQELLPDIERAHAMWGKLDGLSTGYVSLDRLIMGLKGGEVILIAGSTSMGKSALATNIAVNVAKTKDVLFISLEMTAAELGSRMMYLNDGNLDDLGVLFQKQYDLSYKNLKPLLIRSMKLTDDNIKLVVLDYLQYLGRGMDNDEMARISKSLKALAMELNVPFIVITQIRKGATGKFRTKWTDIEIEDLMGTAAIGYDADIALLVSRKNLDDEFVQDKIWVRILKNRSRGLDYDNNTIELGWDKTKIIDINA